MSEWEVYTGSDEQIAELNMSNFFLLKLKDNAISYVLQPPLIMSEMDNEVTTHYLICNPHPLADMICQQARTGQPVWVKGDIKVMHHLAHTGNKITSYPTYTVIETNTPDWNIPGAEYSFTTFED